MKSLLRLLTVVLLLFGAQNVWAELQIGQVPQAVTLSGDMGGRLDGTAWNCNDLKGKVSVFFYVDPDEKDLNNEASEALKAEKFPLDRYQSFAVINMAATWLPNFAISSSLEEKQKQYPTTIYVRDYKKVLVKEWGLSDNNSDILVFDKNGNLIFRKDGKLGESDIKVLIKTIQDHLDQ